jgi:hypothetical protein
MKALKMTYEYHELRGVGHGAMQAGAHHIFKFFAKHSKPQAKSGISFESHEPLTNR